jgi:hypothetical protein
MKNSMFLLAFFLCVSALGQGYRPSSGFVPDSKTAVKIAEAVLMPVYGEKQIESERPFAAMLKGNVWTVSGTLRCPDGKGGTTTSCEGGTAEVQIAKDDGRILSMIHYM